MACGHHSVGGYDEERFKNKIDPKLICPICQNVLKNPVQCANEHYFCDSCVRKYLQENLETCPICRDDLTEASLKKPPRVLLELLHDLKIRCDHVGRGCPELIKLEFLDGHLEICGYSPLRCTNQSCPEVFNRRDKLRHESELCQFRVIVCEECKGVLTWRWRKVHACFMRRDMDELSRKFERFEKDVGEIKDEVKQIKVTQEEFIKEVRSMMASRDDVDGLKAELARLHEVANERSDLFTGRETIFVCGGHDGKTRLNSVESYSWAENTWTLEAVMNEKRSGASAFVHERQVFITGGRNRTKNMDSTECLNVDVEPSEWIKSPVKMPINCHGHRVICYEDSAILTGGSDDDNVSSGIYEVRLNLPYDNRLLTLIPEPRCFHGCQIIDNKIVLAGGRSSKFISNAKNTVYVYDINNNTWKEMVPLPFAISGMATVSYKGNIVLIGGVNEKGQTLNTTIMYDVKTGNIKMLPNLNHKRAASAAIITGNVILVFGGYDWEIKAALDSVECLDLNTGNAWRELSPMITKRGAHVAFMKPT